MNILADSHTHTNFSVDALDDMFKMCQSAVNKGLSHICFTEHVDHNPLDNSYNYFNYDKYFASIERAREKFGDKINILAGVEFGEPHLYPKEFEKFLNKKLDVVMAGIHFIAKGKIALHWFGKNYRHNVAELKKYTPEKVFQEYYKEVLESVKLGGFDVLAHFDNPKRYLGKMIFQEELVEEIILELVKSDIAIEINTSPLRRGYHETSPDAKILTRYIGCGGRKVTIGSDAHRREDIIADFDYAISLVKSCRGTLGVFQNRCFVPH